MIWKPLSENVTSPRALAIRGVSGVMRTSLPASVTLPCTFERSSVAKGSCKRNLPVASPLTEAWDKASPVIWLMGDLLTTVSSEGAGPRTSALTTTVVVLMKSGICASIRLSCNPPASAMRPLAPITRMLARSKTSSPVRLVSIGQGAWPGGCSPGGTYA
jgi:hypothetical protein